MAREHVIDGPHGSLRVRVYAAADPSGEAIVWAHGGGFAAGSLDMPEGDWVSRGFASRGVTTVAVDYALSPVPYKNLFVDMDPRGGVRYPVASEELEFALDWTREHASDWGADPEKIAIGGASAGANLAAGVAVRTTRHARTRPSHVVLAYPTLHAVQPATPPELAAALAAASLTDQFAPEPVRFMYENYLGGSIDGIDAVAAPGTASADDLVGYPPTTIVTADVDELRVSAEAFAETLSSAGADVRIDRQSGTQHGYLNIPGSTAAGEATLDRFVARLRA